MTHSGLDGSERAAGRVATLARFYWRPFLSVGVGGSVRADSTTNDRSITGLQNVKHVHASAAVFRGLASSVEAAHRLVRHCPVRCLDVQSTLQDRGIVCFVAILTLSLPVRIRETMQYGAGSEVELCPRLGTSTPGGSNVFSCGSTTR
jgi:hypothetical protein